MYSLYAENSQSDFVLFQSVSTIREAIIREWLLLPAEEKTELRSYLLQYLTSHLSLTSYVRSQILHTIAVSVKRATMDVECKLLFESLLDSVQQLLASGDVRMVSIKFLLWSYTDSIACTTHFYMCVCSLLATFRLFPVECSC